MEQKWINDFVPLDSEMVKDSNKEDGDSQKQEESSKKRPRAEHDEESVKKQKLEDDAEREELIIKADGSFKNYKIFSEMLDDFDRPDVIDLYWLVKERMLNRRLEVDHESEMAFELLRSVKKGSTNRENTRRVMPVEITTSNALISCDGLGDYDWSLESVEARLIVYKKNESVYKEDIKLLKREIYLKEIAITGLRRKLELAQKQKDEIQLTVEKLENSSKILSILIDFKTSEAKDSADKPNVVKKNNGAPIIEDWVSDSE
ncbi:hypothetical protein Tco_0807125 [Tanacetum coccineum]